MPLPYSPPVSPTYVAFPVDIIAQLDFMTPESVNVPFRAAFDSLERLRLDQVEDIGVMAALQTKLGLPVIDSSDVALPTYAGSHVLTSAAAHHSALNTLDTEAGVTSGKLDNVNANVGGDVINPGAPTYASGGVVFSDGDSHHTALEKIDDYATTTRGLSTAAAGDAATAASGVTNIADKLGVGAELAPPFDYVHELLLSDGDKIKDIIDTFDAILFASRRLADQSFGQMLANFVLTDAGINASFYDTLIDLTKKAISTTATIDTLLFEATGDGTEYIATFTAPVACTEVALIWDIDPVSTITFEANAIGSLAALDFVTIGTQRTFVAFAASGVDIVIKASITGASSKLFNIAAAVKP